MKAQELIERVAAKGLTLHEFSLKYGIGYGSMSRLRMGYRPMTMSTIEERLEMLEDGEDMPRPHKIV